jgi:hypothetical protein
MPDVDPSACFLQRSIVDSILARGQADATVRDRLARRVPEDLDAAGVQRIDDDLQILGAPLGARRRQDTAVDLAMDEDLDGPFGVDGNR